MSTCQAVCPASEYQHIPSSLVKPNQCTLCQFESFQDDHLSHTPNRPYTTWGPFFQNPRKLMLPSKSTTWVEILCWHGKGKWAVILHPEPCHYKFFLPSFFIYTQKFQEEALLGMSLLKSCEKRQQYWRSWLSVSIGSLVQTWFPIWRQKSWIWDVIYN
jgi:hypothetical protein